MSTLFSRSVAILAALLLTFAFVSEAKSAPIPADVQGDMYDDPLPKGAIARIGTIRLRNAGEISWVALSGDDKFLVTAPDGPLNIWNAKTGAFVREIPLPLDSHPKLPESKSRERAAALTFPTGSKQLHVLTQRGNLFVCDITNGTWSKPLAQSGIPGDQHRHALGRLSPDGTHIMYTPITDEKATGIEVFTIEKDKPVIHIKDDKFTQFGKSPSMSANNELLATILKDGTAKVWDVKTGKAHSVHTAPEGVFYSITISPDSKSLVAVCGPSLPNFNVPEPKDRFLYAWDRTTGKELFRTPKWESLNVAYSPDGSRLISFTSCEVLVTDATTGKLMHRLKGHGAWAIFGFAFSADGKKLVTGSRDHTAIIWDLTAGKAALDFESPRGPVDVLAFSPDGKTLFTGCAEDHIGGLWDAKTGKRKHWLVADGKGNPLAATFTPDGKHVVVGYGVSRTTGTGKDWAARLWSTTDGKLVREFAGHANGVHELMVSPDGKQLATRDWGRKVRFWNLDTGILNREIDWAEHNVPVSFAVSRDGELVGISSERENGSEVINLTTGKTLSTWKADNPENRLVLSPDGRFVAISEYPRNYKIQIRDTSTGKVVQTLPPFLLGSLCVAAFSPDAKVLALNEGARGVSADDPIYLFDVKTGKEIRTIRGHKGLVASIAFSPDGKRLATGSWDSTVLIWDLTTKP